MSGSKKRGLGGLVYSTDPNFIPPHEEAEEVETLPAAQQKLRVQLDKKNRGGKVVTLVTGFVGTGADMEALGKQLKNLCGTGGSAKDGEILVQGDQREKLITWLVKQGYSQAKRVG
jgi:translation initiation factor 1